MDSDDIYVGIDLGTSNSCCYFVRNGTIIPLSINGRNIIPSYVDYKNNGSVVVGRAAKMSYGYGYRTSNVIRNSKRIIGKSYNSPSVTPFLDLCGVPIKNVNNKPVFHIDSLNRDITPKMVATEIIKYFLNEVEKVCKCKPAKVCVTIPARFGHNERKLTMEAVEEAGVPRDRICIQNEPAAAAYCYGLDNVHDQSRVLVYDLGGGTFDLTYLKINGDNYDAVYHEGNPHLGGSDFDKLIFDWICKQFEEEHHRPFLPKDLPERTRQLHLQKILQIVEECKIGLSTSEDMTFSYPFVNSTKQDDDDDDEEEDEYSIHIDRPTLDTILEKEIDITMDLVRSSLARHSLTTDDVDCVVLVGGSSKLHLVSEKLASIFDHDKLRYGVNPDECVAQGACIFLTKPVVIHEVTSRSLGARISGNRVICLLPAQTPIPNKYTTEVKTSDDYQKTAFSSVIQADQRKEEDIMAVDETCQELHPLSWSNFEVLPRGEVKFEITYRIDETCLLHVRVVEKKTRKVLIMDEVVKVVEI